MQQFNYPTTILYGQGSLDEFINRLKEYDHTRILVVTDSGIAGSGLLKMLTDRLERRGTAYVVFDRVKPNPDEQDVWAGVEVYKKEKCDSLIALGGGSPMDTAKVIKILTVNKPPLEQYDDSLGGDRLITGPMPPLYAIPTTAGTGSEVGRSGVIVLTGTGKKTIFFHPDLMPKIAVLEPEMTTGLPPGLTAATGIDAFSHCMEAYFAAGFHPMADGIALEGMKLVLDWLPVACKTGNSIEAREKMLLASSMGSTAFQKGLGMVHSLAHPLSSLFGMHHGLANALMIPPSLEFLEKSSLNNDQRGRIDGVRGLFRERNYRGEKLSGCLLEFIQSLGIDPGLSSRGISGEDIERLGAYAFSDPCHSQNMIPLTENDLKEIYRAAL